MNWWLRGRSGQLSKYSVVVPEPSPMIIRQGFSDVLPRRLVNAPNTFIMTPSCAFDEVAVAHARRSQGLP